MRILIDTNIIIPLEDIGVNFDEKLAELSRLASGKHELLIHPASYEDIERDKNEARRNAMLGRLKKYNQLIDPPKLEAETEARLFGNPVKPNDNVDNRILYAVNKDCVHWLISEDDGIHKKARNIDLAERVFQVEQVIAALLRLESESVNLYPHIDDVPCHALDLNNVLFDSLRDGYSGFDTWFKEKCCQTGRHAWICMANDSLAAICIYKNERSPIVTIENHGLPGKTLKLCTFKVVKRGYKIGELLLKQAFTYAKDNEVNYVYVTIDPDDHDLLHQLFSDFGFYHYGIDQGGRDHVYIKEFPHSPPNTDEPPLDYAIKYFPTFKLGGNAAFLVPIQPCFHKILFPELERQGELFTEPTNSAGNAIKQAYICKSPNKSLKPGDVLFFYRTRDGQHVSSYGIVDQFFIENDTDKIFQWVSKRTVYSYLDIKNMAANGREVKVILFRLIGHLDVPISYARLKQLGVVSGPIQSIISIDKSSVEKILRESGINDCFISN
jgi:rRNA-processing protein FCF1